MKNHNEDSRFEHLNPSENPDEDIIVKSETGSFASPDIHVGIKLMSLNHYLKETGLREQVEQGGESKKRALHSLLARLDVMKEDLSNSSNIQEERMRSDLVSYIHKNYSDEELEQIAFNIEDEITAPKNSSDEDPGRIMELQEQLANIQMFMNENLDQLDEEQRAA